MFPSMNVQIPTSSATYYKDLSAIDMNLQNCALFSPSPPMPIQKRSNLPTQLSQKPFVPVEKVSPIVKGQKTTVESQTGEGCICERPEGVVLCQRCGFELKGRLQRACSSHPKKICLMDHRECPNKFCRSVHLIEVPLDDSA